MIVDPVEMLKKTSTIQVIPTAVPSKVPLPSIVPDVPEKQFVGHNGTTTLWVVFVIMVIASAVFTLWSWRIPVSRRLYHIITTLITIIAAISYFAMATGHGVAVHHIHIHERHKHVPDTTHEIHRQVFWARYVDWALTTPLLLVDLGLLAGISGAHLTLAILADVIMILTGLFAAFGSEGTGQKWGWYAIACIAYLVIIWHLFVNGRAQAALKSQQVSSFFLAIAGFTIVVWTVYPIIWGIADGGRHLSVNGEIIAYAVLDILAKPVFGLWLLGTHARVPETNVHLGGFWAHGFANEGRLRLGDDDGA